MARKPERNADDGFTRRLTTTLTFDDLVLKPATMHQIEHILAWITHEKMILKDWGLRRHLKPGYRALFSGASGTGKTLTATLLGQRAGREVYRLDLSMIVSKYIGETEKNLERIFDRAESKDWILFFDEADALFGKRSNVSDSHDRHANQEVSYLLQRIEDHTGLVILATNRRDTIDAAFLRRFQSLVAFERPDAEARKRLWSAALDARIPLEDDVDVAALAEDHDLTGGQISEALRFATINALRRGSDCLAHADLASGATHETTKGG